MSLGKWFMKRQLNEVFMWNTNRLRKHNIANVRLSSRSFIMCCTAQGLRGVNNEQLTLPGSTRRCIHAHRSNTVKRSDLTALKQTQNIGNVHTLLPALPWRWDWSGDRWIRCKWGPKTQRSHIQPAILPVLYYGILHGPEISQAKARKHI